MTTRVVLIRHAPTAPGSRLCGTVDLPLTQAGRAQVEAVVGRKARRETPDALYTSTLTRARDVADALGRAWSLEARAAEWAREIHCGHLEGISFDRLRREFPEVWARNEAQNDEGFAWPGGESYRQFRARVLGGLTRIADEHGGQRVAIVTHAGVISQVLGVARQRPASAWEPDRPDPFTATEVEWRDGSPRAVLSFNDPDWY